MHIFVRIFRKLFCTVRDKLNLYNIYCILPKLLLQSYGLLVCGFGVFLGGSFLGFWGFFCVCYFHIDFFVTPILQRHLDSFKCKADWTLIIFMYREKDRLEEIPPWETGLVLIFSYCAFLHEDKVIAASWLLECKWPLDHFKNWKKPNCWLGTLCLLLTIHAHC